MEIIYQNEYIVAVNKPSGLLVHRSRECTDRDNLLKQVRNAIGQLVYPLHRLDRAVSGVVIFCLKPEYVSKFQSIWHTPEVKKFYLGLTRGLFSEAGEFNFDLSDQNKVKKSAITKYRPLFQYKSATLVEIEILTGRHHQIRRHFARRVDHLLGDRKYGKKKYNDDYLNRFELRRIFLHSHRFEFTCPLSNQHTIIKCPLSTDLQRTLFLLKPERLEILPKTDYINEYILTNPEE